MNNSRLGERKTREARSATPEILTEGAFHRMLQIEQNRSRRADRPFALLTVETRRALLAGNDFDLLPRILSVVHDATRESDLTGWMETGASVGVVLTEVHPEKGLAALQARISAALQKCLTPEQLAGIRFQCSIYPAAWPSSEASARAGAVEFSSRAELKKPARKI